MAYNNLVRIEDLFSAEEKIHAKIEFHKANLASDFDRELNLYCEALSKYTLKKTYPPPAKKTRYGPKRLPNMRPADKEYDQKVDIVIAKVKKMRKGIMRQLDTLDEDFVNLGVDTRLADIRSQIGEVNSWLSNERHAMEDKHRVLGDGGSYHRLNVFQKLARGIGRQFRKVCDFLEYC